MKKHYTVLMLVTLFITLSACGRPDVDKNDAVPEQPVERETTEEQVYIKDSIEDSIEDFIEDPLEDSIQDAESSSDAEAEEEIKEETEWTETDEQWNNRRMRSNSELEVTIECTDRSMVNENGLTIASIYYDRPVVSGDTVAAEKIMQFFEDEILKKLPDTYPDKASLAKDVAIVHGELLFIHPFREGNGRTARILANLMVRKQGYEGLRFDKIHFRDYVVAVQRVSEKNYLPMQRIIETIF